MTNALWYLGRGSGVSALTLFTLVVVLGVVVRSGRPLPGLPRFAVTALHRTVSLTALVMLLVHIVTLLFDPFAQLRIADVVIPFRGAYRPLWLGFGTLAFDLVLILTVLSLLRHRIGHRTWRGLHWLAYACWPAAIVHSLGNGTDRASRWLVTTDACCVAMVIVAVGWRFLVVPPADRPDVAVPAPPNLTGMR